MRATYTTLAFAALLTVMLASSAAAQNGDQVETCKKAVKTVENGHPAHKETSALAKLASCGKDGATVMARAVTESRTEADPTVLLHFYWDVDLWRDAQVMDAAIALARDPSAATPSRVFAIRHILGLLNRRAEFDYAGLLEGVRVVTEASGAQYVTGGCRFAMGSEVADLSGTALPADFRTRLRAVLLQLSGDTGVTSAVRNAAACGNQG